MDVGLRATRKAVKEVRDQLGLQVADDWHIDQRLDNISCTPGEIDSADGERLIHRHHKVSRAQDALLVAQRLRKRLAQRDADVLHRVVLVHVEVADALQRQVEPAVSSKQLQHVVEEPDAGAHRVLTRAIDVQPQRDLRLRRIALDRADALRPYRLRRHAELAYQITHTRSPPAKFCHSPTHSHSASTASRRATRAGPRSRASHAPPRRG